MLWSALDAVVKEDALPTWDDAWKREDTALKAARTLRDTFSVAWRNKEAKRRKLRHATTHVLNTKASFRNGLLEIQDALIAWGAHDCDGAEQHASTANQLIQQAQAPLNEASGC